MDSPTKLTGVSITLAAECGCGALRLMFPLKVVSEILGHSSIAITCDVLRTRRTDISRDADATLAAASASKGWPTGVRMVVKPAQKATMGRSGPLRRRPLTCNLLVGLRGTEPATPRPPDVGSVITDVPRDPFPQLRCHT
jgi:hypothetical protein